MADSTADKTQDPTPHRREKAREEGQVARSLDLGSAILLLVGVGTLLWSGGAIIQVLARYGRHQLGGDAWLAADLATVVSHWNDLLAELARVLLPLLGVLVATAILVNLGQVGFLFLPSKLSPDPTRLDPLAGFRRIFSPASSVRLGFGVLKIAVIASVAVLCLYHELPALLGLSERSVADIARYAGDLLLWTGMKIGLAMLVLAVLDYGYQRWRHEQDLKMTPQEVREELRNLEGNPQLIARRRSMQRQMALNRLTEAVPKAKVVITATGNLAVALRYDPETMSAPVIVAKGVGAVGERIRDLALQHAIPTIENRQLAEVLHREVEVTQPIPPAQYQAAADVLAEAYQRQGRRRAA